MLFGTCEQEFLSPFWIFRSKIKAKILKLVEIAQKGNRNDWLDGKHTFQGRNYIKGEREIKLRSPPNFKTTHFSDYKIITIHQPYKSHI